MGVLATRVAAAFEARNDTGWLTRDDGEDPYGTMTPSGVRVSQRAALGLTTIWRCWDLLSSAVAQAPKDIILKIGQQSFPEYGKPQWLVTPNPADPTYTASDYFSQVALSTLSNGNYFVAALPHVLDPNVTLIVLDPDRVEVRPGPMFDIKDNTGKVIRTLGPMQMLHGTWMQLPGHLRGISPLEALRRGVGSAIAAEDFAGRFFGQGATLAFGVEYPMAMDPTKLDNLRNALRRKYNGPGNQHVIGVLTDGAKFVGGLGPTPEQAQMIATRKYGVEELARIYGVPAAMVGSTEPGAASFASTENYDRWFKDRAVLPLAARIEDQHNRLVQVPDSISDPNASAQFKFNLDWLVRGNLLERAQAADVLVKGGIMTPDEARGKEDLPPLPGGDLLYMLQQMVPLADLGKTKATEPLDTQPKPAGVAQ